MSELVATVSSDVFDPLDSGRHVLLVWLTRIFQVNTMSPAFATEEKLTIMYRLKPKFGASKGPFPHKVAVTKPFQAR